MDNTKPLAPAATEPRAEERLRQLGLDFPAGPSPFGAYLEAAQTGNLLFLPGMLPPVGTSRHSWGAWGRNSMRSRGARRRELPQPMSSPPQDNILDHWTGW